MMLQHVNDETFPYLLYAHPDAEKESLPLVIFLHGAGERGGRDAELSRMTVHSLPALLEQTDPAAPGAPRCVAVCPMCPHGQYWACRVESVLAFIRRMVEKYHADPDRVSLTGVSMGGYGTWFTAIAAPELFSCIAPVCGGGMPWAAGVLKMPVRAFHGDVDITVPVSESIDMVNALKAHGNKDAELTVYHDVGHNCWIQAYTPALLEWMLAQKRPARR